MQDEAQPVDISDLPDLLELAEKVQSSKQPVVLKRGREEIAVISPVQSQKTSQKAAKPKNAARANDWLLRLADIGAASAS